MDTSILDESWFGDKTTVFQSIKLYYISVAITFCCQFVCVCVQYNALLLGDLVRLDEVDIATSRQRASETMLFCSKFYTNATSVIQNCAVF